MLTRICIACLPGLLSFVVYAEIPKQPTVHRRTEFAFVVHAPLKTAFPLFGAYQERAWADRWDPNFLHPEPANDQPGAVFTLKTGHSSVWIDTVYDRSQGHIQYACFAKEEMTTLIDIRLRRRSATTTTAVVVYERTALQPEANEYVNQMADSDKAKGPEWEAAINAYLQKGSK